MAWNTVGRTSIAVRQVHRASSGNEGCGSREATGMDRKQIPLRAGARLVNRCRKHVRQWAKLFCCLPSVSLGILVGEVFAYPQVFIRVINPMPGALHVDEYDPVRTNADLLDSEPSATVKDCLT